MDAVGPDVDVALCRQIALLPRGVFVEPAVLQATDGGGRQPGSILAEQRSQRLREVAGRDTLQIKDRQQRLDRFRAAHVGRQDRRREPDAVGVGGVRLTIAYTWLADGNRTDAGHHLAFGQVAVAHDALVAVRGLQIGMLAEKVGDFGLDRLGEKGTCPVAQDFCELVVEDSWLNQLDDVIVDTAYRSFGGEVEASSTPTICRLSDSRRHQLSAIAPPGAAERPEAGPSLAPPGRNVGLLA